VFQGITRLLTVTGAIAVACATTSGGAAAAAAPAAQARQPHPVTTAVHSSRAKPVPAPTVVRLHQAYESQLLKVRPARIPGIGYAHVKLPKPAGGITNGCAEPNCPLTYNGGAVQHHPHVYLLLWGPNWTTDQSQYGTYTYLAQFYAGLGVQPLDDWSRITEEYPDANGPPVFNGSVYIGAWQDTSTPPYLANPTQLGAEAAAFAAAIGITDTADAQVVVATQSGTCPFGFGCGNPNGQYCSWHDATQVAGGVPFTNLPYQSDSPKCDSFTVTAGHEYAESITDPYPPTGWWDLGNGTEGEVADKCENAYYGTWVTLSTGGFEVPYLFSNTAYTATGNGCTPVSWPDNVTVTSPGNQTSAAHAAASAAVWATSTGKFTLGFSAAGLPPGLAMNWSTGVISGTPTSTGTYHVTVYASDETGAVGSAGFTWTVTGPGDTVAITNPGPQTSLVRLKMSLQMQASSSGGFPLTYTATGLPPGLSINSATGLISGNPTVTGTYSVTVTAGDKTGDSAAAGFAWTVKPIIPPCQRGQICS